MSVRGLLGSLKKTRATSILIGGASGDLFKTFYRAIGLSGIVDYPKYQALRFLESEPMERRLCHSTPAL